MTRLFPLLFIATLAVGAAWAVWQSGVVDRAQTEAAAVLDEDRTSLPAPTREELREEVPAAELAEPEPRAEPPPEPDASLQRDAPPAVDGTERQDDMPEPDGGDGGADEASEDASEAAPPEAAPPEAAPPEAAPPEAAPPEDGARQSVVVDIARAAQAPAPQAGDAAFKLRMDPRYWVRVSPVADSAAGRIAAGPRQIDGAGLPGIELFKAPIYPAAARTEGREGTVTALFDLAPDGRPIRIRIVSAQPPGYFEEAVTRAFDGLRFAPPEDPEAAQEVPFIFEFSLHEGAQEARAP